MGEGKEGRKKSEEPSKAGKGDKRGGGVSWSGKGKGTCWGGARGAKF